jgi:hypothetical protein
LCGETFFSEHKDGILNQLKLQEQILKRVKVNRRCFRRTYKYEVNLKSVKTGDTKKRKKKRFKLKSHILIVFGIRLKG